MTVTAAEVKAKALALGSDLVGIASAEALNAHPPDPKYPQTPASVSPEIQSVIALVFRMPIGGMRATNAACVHYMDQLVLKKQDRVAYDLSVYLEEHGSYAFPLPAQETVWEMKNASYGYLSTRHVAIEAGLGTLGIDLNLLTKEFGPRCYTTCVLTTAVLEPDTRMTEQLCIGEPCNRCLYSCPGDAVLHWNLDKRACATAAQEFGFATLLKTLGRFIDSDDPRERRRLLKDPRFYGIWQSMIEQVGAFGDCPRCLAVCPVGDDYVFLRENQKYIPEKTPEKVGRAKTMQQDRKAGAPIAGLTAWNVRWIGEEGYKKKRPAAALE